MYLLLFFFKVCEIQKLQFCHPKHLKKFPKKAGLQQVRIFFRILSRILLLCYWMGVKSIIREYFTLMTGNNTWNTSSFCEVYDNVVWAKTLDYRSEFLQWPWKVENGSVLSNSNDHLGGSKLRSRWSTN